MHSHHTHSGDYIAHGADTLEEVVSQAERLGFHTWCLTEHMPRLDSIYIYPEEHERETTIKELQNSFDRYYEHARKIQASYKDSTMNILVGAESEGIDLAHMNKIVQLKAEKPLDFIVGSIHHVKEIDIDYSREIFETLIKKCGGSLRNVYNSYFDEQYEMLRIVKPEVVGHFDLIRLFVNDTDIDEDSGKKVIDLDISKYWPEVYQKIIRNIKLIKELGSLVEINSAGLRKGLSTPYPAPDICQMFIDNGVEQFAFSDDSHSIKQVATNYKGALHYVDEMLHLKNMYYLSLENKKVVKKCIEMEKVRNDPFWKNL